jgi:hypothetical protein
MTDKKLRDPPSKSEMDIQTLIERWAKAIREENREGIRAEPNEGSV